MDPWWWVPIGLAAWLLVAVLVAPCVGAVLKRCSQTREAIDQQLSESQADASRPGNRRCPQRSTVPVSNRAGR